jgi:hypothetical protein
MSVDQQDLSRSTQLAQQGVINQIWPIRIAPPASLNTIVEVPISPCDAIWMPATYDKSYGTNPGQSITGANGTIPAYISPTIAGANMVDLYDVFNALAYCLAPIFALRFNSPNAPWLLWGLSEFQTISASPVANAYSTRGQGGGMRSISGPISRMWIQYYRWCKQGVSSVSAGADNIPASQVVLISSLGITQSTGETKGPPSNENGGGITTIVPTGNSYRSLGSGGYYTPQLNTLDQLQLGDRGTTKPTV